MAFEISIVFVPHYFLLNFLKWFGIINQQFQNYKRNEIAPELILKSSSPILASGAWIVFKLIDFVTNHDFDVRNVIW